LFARDAFTILATTATRHPSIMVTGPVWLLSCAVFGLGVYLSGFLFGLLFWPRVYWSNQWPVSPSRIASIMSITGLTSSWSAQNALRQLANGVEPLLPWQNDKPTVMALREIAQGLIKPAMLAEADRAAEDAAEALEKALAAEFGLQEFDDEARTPAKAEPADDPVAKPAPDASA
jgi:DNA-directed RNA polymerase subunit omega